MFCTKLLQNLLNRSWYIWKGYCRIWVFLVIGLMQWFQKSVTHSLCVWSRSNGKYLVLMGWSMFGEFPSLLCYWLVISQKKKKKPTESAFWLLLVNVLMKWVKERETGKFATWHMMTASYCRATLKQNPASGMPFLCFIDNVILFSELDNACF